MMIPISAIMIVASTFVAIADVGERANVYPNELPGFTFFSAAPWKSVRPMIMTKSEVFALLGEPEPVFYEAGPDWKFIVFYHGEGGSCDGQPWPPGIVGKVAKIELRPVIRVSFAGMRFPSAFEKLEQFGPHDVVGSWDVYSDAYGLQYKVYNAESEDGSTRAGDLMAIVYGPSRTLFTELTGCSVR